MTAYSDQVPLTDWARQVAQDALAGPCPGRWAHVQGVAEVAREVGERLGPDGDLLVAAAWLHDVGWAPEVAVSEFPAIDGARYLQRLGAPPRLVNLCANYGAAAVEARFYRRESEMTEFPDERGPVRDALWYCDLRVGPDGQRMSFSERIGDTLRRYGEHPLVTPWMAAVEPELRAAYQRTEELLDERARTV